MTATRYRIDGSVATPRFFGLVHGELYRIDGSVVTPRFFGLVHGELYRIDGSVATPRFFWPASRNTVISGALCPIQRDFFYLIWKQMFIISLSHR